MKLTLIFSAIILVFSTACDSSTVEHSTPVPPGCIVTVENHQIIPTEQCDLDGDGVEQ